MITSGEYKAPTWIYRENDSLFEYILDDILIADGQGVILWVSPSFKRNYGVTENEILGKTVFEMEEQKIFYPSITAMVLKKRSKITFLQYNRKGRKIIVTAVPIFKEKEIERVVSFSWDVNDYLALKEQYEKIENMRNRYSSEIRKYREKEMCVPGIIAKSPQMKNVLRLAMKVAAVETNVLITGESGVGKNLIARMIHQNSSRRENPFIEINCGAIPENLLESELFGYEPGAFTGANREGKIGMVELAQEGTLFLDEIGELPLNLQVKLLKVIQEKNITKIGGTKPVKVDFRLIAATNQDLESLVKVGRFRQDLFYRLNVVPIHIPPLRERPEDIFSLIIHFLEQANKQYRKHKTFSNNAINILMSYTWPGNVRELQNLVERLVITSDEDHISEDSLPDNVKVLPTIGVDEGLTLKKALELLEKQMVQEAYDRYKSTVGVAKALGISQPSAARKLKKYIAGYSGKK